MGHQVGQLEDELVETPTPVFPELLPGVTAWVPWQLLLSYTTKTRLCMHLPQYFTQTEPRDELHVANSGCC